MSLYSPQEREEYDRTGERPGLEDLSRTRMRRSAGRIRVRLAYMAVVLVVAGLVQLVNVARDLAFAFNGSAAASVGILAAGIDIVAAALALGLAGQLWYLRGRDKPAPVVVATSIATAVARGLLTIAKGSAAGRPAALAIVLPLVVCGLIIWLVRARARETRAATV